MKKIVKLAVIRDNDNDPCPFGLPIAFGCKNAGQHINRMYPIEAWKEATPQDKEKIKMANMRLLTWAMMMGTEQPQKCIYADDLFDEKSDKVNCSYGDTAAGQGIGSKMYDGIPSYNTMFAGMGLSGIGAIPFAALTENNVMKNTYYGVMSLQGHNNVNELVSLAEGIYKEAAFEPPPKLFEQAKAILNGQILLYFNKKYLVVSKIIKTTQFQDELSNSDKLQSVVNDFNKLAETFNKWVKPITWKQEISEPNLDGWKYQDMATPKPLKIEMGDNDWESGDYYNYQTNLISIQISPILDVSEEYLKDFYTLVSRFNNSAEMAYGYISNMYDVLYHELTHYSQTILKPGILTGLPKKDKSKFNPDGTNNEGHLTQSHAFRDIEAYPRLNDSIKEFKYRMNFIDAPKKDKFIRDFMGVDGITQDTDINFKELLTSQTEGKGPGIDTKYFDNSDQVKLTPHQPDHTKQRYRDMVKAFVKYLQNHPEIMPSGNNNE